MIYKELLQQNEWYSKCRKILSRDHYTCKDCGRVGFHNYFSYAVLEDMNAIDDIFGSWMIDGKRISEFCASFTDYDLEHFEDVKLKEQEEAILADSYLLHFRLFGRNSKYFRGHPRGFHYGNFISNIACDKMGMDAIQIYDAVKHKSFNIRYSWLYAFKFEKELANKVYLSVKGSNSLDKNTKDFSMGEYVISVNYKDMLVVLKIDSTEEIIFNGLNIHHTYYIKGHMPWEYGDDALVTLCENCHKRRHEKAPIPIYATDMSLMWLTTICPKCGGSGYLPQYSHVEDGICFKCGGEGVIGIGEIG